MSRGAKSLLVFGLYLTVLGIFILILPNLFLMLFGFPETNEVWIRIVGMLLFLVSIYYIQAARNEWTAFIQLTVYTRSSVIVFLTVFVLFGLAKPVLILFGVIDLSAAIWTRLALRSSKPS